MNPKYSLANATQLHGKELSYNNIQDGNAAIEILKDFEATVCCCWCKTYESMWCWNWKQH